VQLIKIITISGLSGSGKTKLAYSLNKNIKSSYVISLDNYSYTKKYLQEKYNEIDFSSPQAFNNIQFIEDIINLKKKGSVEIPIFNINTEIVKHLLIKKPEILIVEGMFAKLFSENITTIDIYVDVDLDIALIRKIQRDRTEKNRSIELIIEEHLKNTRKNSATVIRQRLDAPLVIDNNKNIKEFILNDIYGLIYD